MEQRWSSWAQGAWNQLPRAVSTGALHVAPGTHRDAGFLTYLPVIHGTKTIRHLNTSQTQAPTRGLVTCVPCKLATARPHTQGASHSWGHTLREADTQTARHSGAHTQRARHSNSQTLRGAPSWLLLCCCHLETPNNFLTSDTAFSCYTGSHKL